MSTTNHPVAAVSHSSPKRKSLLNRFIHHANNTPSHSPLQHNINPIPPIITHIATDLGYLHHPDPLFPAQNIVQPPPSNPSPIPSSTSPSPPLHRRRSSFRELMSSGAVRLARSLSPNHDESSSPSSPTGRPTTPSNTLSSMLLGPLVSITGLRHSAPSNLHTAAPAQQHPFTEKYGKCERGCIGKGATAVVRVAHKVRPSGGPGSCANLSPVSNSSSSPSFPVTGGMAGSSSFPGATMAILDDASVDQVVAIKEFRKRRKNESEREYLKKVTAEFCISSSLHHVNIVQTLDLIQDEHHHWCEVMEFCPGGDLFSAIQSGLMTHDEMNCYFKQLILGVAYLHRSGVAHRDLKPENLLLDAHGRLKITDFGVSEVFKMEWESKPHLSEGMCGSAPYIAPEVYTDTRYDARKLDIWACGIIYYAMLYHGIPWRQASPEDPNFATYLGVLAHFNKLEPSRRPRGKRGFEALDQIFNNGCDLMYQILDPNPSRRCTVLDIMEHPWFISLYMCHVSDEVGGAKMEVSVRSPPSLHPTHVHHTVIGEVRAESPAVVRTMPQNNNSSSTILAPEHEDVPAGKVHMLVDPMELPSSETMVNMPKSVCICEPTVQLDDYSVAGTDSVRRVRPHSGSHGITPMSKIELAVKNLLHHRHHPSSPHVVK